MQVITSRGFILSTASVVAKQPEQDKLKKKDSKKNKKKQTKNETEKESGKNFKKMKTQKKRKNLEKDSDILHKKKVKKFKRLDKKCEKQEDSERDVSDSQSNLPMPVNQDGQKNKGSNALKKQNLKNDSTKNNNELNHATTIVKSTSQADTRNDREADQRQSNTNLSAPSQAGDVDVAIRPVKNFQEEINSHGTVTESVTLSSPTQQQWTPQKRKKKKSRSKQKNIRKDNRPDHMKPPHLRIKTDTHLPVLGL
ncbi:uncharacterized protein [Ptychodera flava]|uniref:uncharacterized protein n=1 Tax=Ptychodera flava TaxID=63121 RepID=UPI00396A686F